MGVFPHFFFHAAHFVRLHCRSDQREAKPEDTLRSGGANKAKAANATVHSATQAASMWPSTQVSITWSATTNKADNTAASNMPDKVREASTFSRRARSVRG